MNVNEELIHKFYTAFKKLDAATMNSCYSDDIVFNDPGFGLLEAAQVKAMWQMLCSRAKDFNLTYGNIIHLDEEYSTCDWEATYTFSKTGRKVVNKIRANMRFANGKIIEHGDAFSLHRWSAQALGFSGWLLGWNRFFQQKIQNTSRKMLLQYMQKQQ
jgi:ketosteroid isomerase-like protein